MTSGRRFAFAVAALLVFSAGVCSATPEFAERTGKSCAFCHDGANGGPLNNVGVAFVRNSYDYPIPERILDKSIALSGRFHKTVRLILGIIHLITAAILAGTIFYIHIIVKP
ncbi:MAG: hypothetical protein JXA57_07560, partial [Armatimonadetes bacterium]|nr:hypothetical protein [Armatimonadota bacterium]